MGTTPRAFVLPAHVQDTPWIVWHRVRMVERLDEVTIRTADEGDAESIARVHVRSWQEAYTGIVPEEHLAGLDPVDRTATWREHLRSATRDHMTTWVAEAPEHGLVGFATLGPARDEDAGRSDWEVYSIYLDPGTWGHGVARELMRTVIGHAGTSRIYLWVLAENERARHFYRRHGFQADGVERYEQIGGADLLEVRYVRG